MRTNAPKSVTSMILFSCGYVWIKKAAMKNMRAWSVPTLDISMIMDAKVEEMGRMVAGDGGTFHRVEFEALTFYPKMQEIVRGEIIDVTDFGAFVRIGPTDALLHLSQIMDDYLKSDPKSGIILANQSGRTLKAGNMMRTRITAVSLGKGASMGKIGITCRQPFLGADEWIADEIKNGNKPKPVEKPSPKKEKK